MNDSNKNELINISNKIRYYIISCAKKEHTYHFGACLSCVELLVYIYFQLFDNWDANYKNRDRFILSKGHAAFTLYAVLALKKYITIEDLYSYKEIGSPLQGHTDMKQNIAIDFSNASLGQGLSAGIGYALSNAINHNNNRTIVLVGDGETQEGQIWEAAMCASKYQLSNLYCIIDYNKYQVDGAVSDIMPIENIRQRWESFSWNVFEISNGHDFQKIDSVFLSITKNNQPNLIIAHTIKGKGISFMENKIEWHSNYLSDESFRIAIKEVELSEH